MNVGKPRLNRVVVEMVIGFSSAHLEGYRVLDSVFDLRISRRGSSPWFSYHDSLRKWILLLYKDLTL